MPLRRAVFAILFASLGSPLAAAETPLRLGAWSAAAISWPASGRSGACARGLLRPAAPVAGRPRTAGHRRARGDRPRHASGPLWLEQGGRSSNPVWLTLNGSHVLAAGPDEVAKNMDGLTTYVDLVSLLIEENHDGRREAERLADKYGARVVGAIPPLNLYQRLPARDLVQRDALVLRIGSETSVDAVVVEESAPEKGEETEAARRPVDKPDSDSDEWAANRFMDAVNYYQRRVRARQAPLETRPVRIGVIERDVDFDAPDFADYLGPASARTAYLPLRARCRTSRQPRFDGRRHPRRALGPGRQQWFPAWVGPRQPGFRSDRRAQFGCWHHGQRRRLGEPGGGWRAGAQLELGHPPRRRSRRRWRRGGFAGALGDRHERLRGVARGVLPLAAQGASGRAGGQLRRQRLVYSGTDEYRLPSSFVTEQLLVVGGHQRSERQGLAVDDPAYAVKRSTSNVDMRVDVTAAACTHASTLERDARGEVHCGTSYATPMVAGTVAAMLSLNPRLRPEEIRMLLRRSAMTIGGDYDFEPADAEDLTAPILPSERGYRLDHRDVGRSARLDMQKALDLAVKSRERVR